MDNENEPHANGDTSEDGISNKEGSKPATMREVLMRVGATGNLAIQVLNVALESTTKKKFGTLSTLSKVGRGMVYGSSGLGAANSPVVIYKERQLTKEDTLRTALNGIREEQGRLSEENDILSAEVDDLQSEVDRMKDVEMALRKLSEDQGSQLTELMDLINENKEINEGQRAVLKSKVLEAVITLVLDIDNDGSFTIQNKEIDRLIIGMKLIEEISFDEHMFRKDVIACHGNLDEVILLIKQMVHGFNEGDGDGKCTINIDQDPEEWFKKQKSKAA